MSFEIQVTFKEGSEDWDQITSSASHLMEVIATGNVTYTDEDGNAAKKKVFKLKLPNGDVFDCKTKRWTQKPRNPNFV
jgi:hypothetical protein